MNKFILIGSRRINVSRIEYYVLTDKNVLEVYFGINNMIGFTFTDYEYAKRYIQLLDRTLKVKKCLI